MTHWPIEIRVAALAVSWAAITAALVSAPAGDVLIGGSIAAILILVAFALAGSNGRPR